MSPRRCRPATPQESKVLAELTATLKNQIPCGHTIGDLIGAPGTVTACGACMKEKRAPAHDPAEHALLVKVASVCASESAPVDFVPRGELPMSLRPATAEEQRDMHIASDAALWRVDLPTLGVALFGKTPRAAFRRALQAIAEVADDRAIPTKGEGA